MKNQRVNFLGDYDKKWTKSHIKKLFYVSKYTIISLI